LSQTLNTFGSWASYTTDPTAFKGCNIDSLKEYLNVCLWCQWLYIWFVMGVYLLYRWAPRCFVFRWARVTADRIRRMAYLACLCQCCQCFNDEPDEATLDHEAQALEAAAATIKQIYGSGKEETDENDVVLEMQADSSHHVVEHELMVSSHLAVTAADLSDRKHALREKMRLDRRRTRGSAGFTAGPDESSAAE
jgi:hypothetical protein